MPMVTVRYFAQLRDQLRCDLERLELPTTVEPAAVLAAVSARHPQASTLIACCRVAVDLQFASAAVTLGDDSEIALIPPVSGG
jgi:molybdopterin converting factor subunit 1